MSRLTLEFSATAEMAANHEFSQNDSDKREFEH